MAPWEPGIGGGNSDRKASSKESSGCTELNQRTREYSCGVGCGSRCTGDRAAREGLAAEGPRPREAAIFGMFSSDGVMGRYAHCSSVSRTAAQKVQQNGG